MTVKEDTHLDRSKEALSLANRILYARGVLDGFGHVSLRHPQDGARFLMARSLAPSQVTARDIQILDSDGNVVDDDRPPYLERFIHGAIYRARSDVRSVVHSHAPSIIPFGVSAAGLRPIYHMAGFLGAEVPVFEIRRHAGEATDMLIRDGARAAALVRDLDAHPVVLMRGHGMTVVGASLEQAVFRAVYTEVNARAQLAASGLGAITFLNAEEAAVSAEVNDKQIGRAWKLWVQELGPGAAPAG